MGLVVKFKRLDKAMPPPAYAYPEDAAFDLYSAENKLLAPGERHGFKTSLIIEIPDGYAGLVWDKSGLGITGGLKTLGGVIDSGYRGEIIIGIVNLSGGEYAITKGQKIAQMLIQKKEPVALQEIDTLSETERGESGFGSSGK